MAAIMPISTVPFLPEGRVVDSGSESAFDLVFADTCIWGSPT